MTVGLNPLGAEQLRGRQREVKDVNGLSLAAAGADRDDRIVTAKLEFGHLQPECRALSFERQ